MKRLDSRLEADTDPSQAKPMAEVVSLVRSTAVVAMASLSMVMVSLNLDQGDLNLELHK